MDASQEYNQRKAEIEFSRLKAFSSVSHTTHIAGIPCRPLSCRAWIDLKLVGNTLLDGIPTPQSVCEYLFRVNLNYPLGSWGKFRIERVVSKGFRNVRKAEILFGGINHHLRSAFQEVPESMSKTSEKIFKIDAVERVVSAADELAARYGQLPDTILELPLEKIFALQKAARLATIPGYKLLEPSDLRDLKSKHILKKQDEINGKR